jgi:hypothetical protein
LTLCNRLAAVDAGVVVRSIEFLPLLTNGRINCRALESSL